MGNIGDDWVDDVLDSMLGSDHGTRFPGTVYFALFVTAPENDGSGTELDKLGYSRFAITNNTVNFPNAVSGVKTNGTEIGPWTAGELWGVVPYWAIMGANTPGAGDTPIAWGRLGGTTPPKVVSAAVVAIEAGTLRIRIRRTLGAF